MEQDWLDYLVPGKLQSLLEADDRSPAKLFGLAHTFLEQAALPAVRTLHEARQCLGSLSERSQLLIDRAAQLVRCAGVNLSEVIHVTSVCTAVSLLHTADFTGDVLAIRSRRASWCQARQCSLRV